MKRWYVVHTQPHAERRALSHLERQGFRAWLPLYWKRRRHAGRAETVLRPLFPRYLFVHVDLAHERWRPILSTVGVHQLVGGPEGPTAVADAVIGGLMARAGADGHFVLRPLEPRPGDPVRITAGPLADVEGIFCAANDQERVMVLLKLMGREVKVTVSGADVEVL